MNNRNSFILYSDMKNTLSKLPDKSFKAVIMAVFDYVTEDTETEFDELSEEVVFSVIKAALDRDDEKYQKRCRKNRENAKLGGRPKKAEEEKPEAEAASEEEASADDGTEQLVYLDSRQIVGVAAAEYGQLREAHGEKAVREMAESMSDYCLAKGVRYDDYGAALRRWFSGEKNHPSKPAEKKVSYDLDEWERYADRVSEELMRKCADQNFLDSATASASQRSFSG